MELAVRFNVVPIQSGLLLPVVGAAGVWNIVTETVPAGLVVHPGTVTVTEYVPDPSVVILPIVGFCVVDV
jgi:hypothetical protein